MYVVGLRMVHVIGAAVWYSCQMQCVKNWKLVEEQSSISIRPISSKLVLFPLLTAAMVQDLAVIINVTLAAALRLTKESMVKFSHFARIKFICSDNCFHQIEHSVQTPFSFVSHC